MRRILMSTCVALALLLIGAAAGATTNTMIPPIAADWQALGGPGWPLGNPTSSTAPTSCDNGVYNNFQGGVIAYNPAIGAEAVYGAISVAYRQLGVMCGVLGLPLTNESPSACVAGGRYNNFQGGRITWTLATGAEETQGWINLKYLGMGAECSVLGLPLNSESPSACVPFGRYNNFQNGRITWSATTGAHETQGWINVLYRQLGAECSPLGLPLTDEGASSCIAGARVSAFQNGIIEWSPATGAHSIQNLMYARWVTQCRTAGLPLGEAYPCGADICQAFQSGVLSVPVSSCISTPTDFANHLLLAIGEPDNVYNVQAVVAWEELEGGNWKNTAWYNPLDTTQPYDGSTPIVNNIYDVQAYNSWRDGIAATTITIFNGYYGAILSAMAADNSFGGEVAVARAVGNSPWGTPDFEALLGSSYQPPNPPNVIACSA